MTVKELSEYLRLDRMTIYKMLKEGSIPASRIGHQWRFFRTEIDDWLHSLRTGPKASVLLLDGDDTTREMFNEGMSKESYDLVVTTNGDEALKLTSQREFDYVFLELRWSTIDVFRQIRDADDDVPVVVIASPNDGKLVDQAMEVGTFTLMKKPESGQEVKKILSSLPAAKKSL